MKKRILSILLAICMLLSVVPMMSFTASAEDNVCYIVGSDTKYTKIADALDYAGTTVTTIRLIKDVTESIEITSGQTITLDLNGYVLNGGGDTGYYCSAIENRGTLDIIDTNTAKPTHYFTVGSNGKWVWDEDNTTGDVSVDSLTKIPTTGAVISVHGGCITGGYYGTKLSDAYYGGGIFNDGKLTVKGIAVVGNYAGTGGGLHSDSGTVKISNCYIIGNKTDNNGGGIYYVNNDKTNNAAECDIIKCKIMFNKSTSNGGGIHNNGITTITDSSIKYNTSSGDGGGVSNSKDLLVQGCIISNNVADTAASSDGGGIGFDGVGKCILLDTKITENTAKKTGGGVYVGELNGCFVAGTLVTMADGSQKRIEDIAEGDIVKTFDHESGKVSNSKVYLAFKGETKATPFTLKFDNGKTLSVAGCHDLLEKSTRKYVTLNKSNATDYIGKYFYNEDGNWHKLVSVTKENTPCEYYSIYTAEHQNCFANGFLSVPDDVDYLLNIYELDANLKADKAQLNADIEKYGLVSYEYACELRELSREWYNAVGAKYMFIAVGKGLYTLEEAEELYDTIDDENGQLKLTSFEPGLVGEGDKFKGFSSGVLTIGDGTVITDNESGDGSNVYLNSGFYIYIEDTLSSTNVGVTLSVGEGKFTTNGAKTDEAYFFSDKPAYVDKYKTDGYLELTAGYSVTEASCENGSVSVGNQKSAYVGETVTVTTKADSGYEVYEVYYNDGTQHETDKSESGVYSFTMPATAVTVSATFNPSGPAKVCYIDLNKNGKFDDGEVKYLTVSEAVTAAGTTASTIVMIADSTENVTIPVDATITLDLNGNILSRPADSTAQTIVVKGNLTVKDSGSSTVTKLKYADNKWVIDNDNGTVTVNGGIITGGTGEMCAVSVEGTFTLKSGNIAGNNITTMGGAVYLSKNWGTGVGATFNMEGGKIQCNTAGYGAGVGVCENSSFNMTGGEISNNIATGGGGAYVKDTATMTMTGGTVTNNSNMGVTVESGSVVLGGSANINGNKNGTANSNLFLWNGKYATISTATPPTTMSVGVTLESGTGKFTTNGATTDLTYFTSDNAAYDRKFSTDHLELTTSSIPADMASAKYYCSLTLNDNIDIKFAIRGANLDSTKLSKLKVYFDDEEVNNAVGELKDGDITFTAASVGPENMGKSVNIKVMYDGNKVKEIDYSVLKYCNQTFKYYGSSSNATDIALVSLCYATLNYGEYAQKQAGLDTGFVTDGISMPDFNVNVKNETVTQSAKTLGGGISEARGSLSTGSETAINFYLTTTNDYSLSDEEDYSKYFKITNNNGENVDPKCVSITPCDGGYKVTLSKIGASRLARNYTISTNDDKFSLTYGPYNYMQDIQSSTDANVKDADKNLANSMYIYAQAAQTYYATITK